MRPFACIRAARRAVALCAALLLLGAGVAAAQSLLANRGLGLVIEPADARAAGMGGVQLGLAQSEFSWVNPADLIGMPAPGMRFAFQYDDFTSDFGAISLDGSTARFPVLQVATPIGERLAVSVGFGGFLDQNFAVQRDTSLVVGSDTTAVLDRLTSEGGVARLRFGAAYEVIEGLAVGVGMDVYTGDVEQSFGRRFFGEGTPACCTARWEYSGLGAVAGLTWTPSEAARLAVAASFGGTLEAESDSASAVGSYDLPVTLHAGGSARVAPTLLATLSGDWAGWSTLDARLEDVGGARDSWSVRGGLEWDGIQLRDRPVPIRLGGRHSALPFSWGQPLAPTEGSTERAITSGIGLVLGGGATLTDVALERGWRGGDGAGLEESFWRVILSVTVLGR